MGYVNWMERAIKATKEPRPFLKYMEYYVEECMEELNEIDTPCYNEINYGKSGEQPAMSSQSNNMIYEVIPRLTECLAYTKPNKGSVFAVNHFFRLILILCRRCIELDIECFRLLEIIFGFIRKDNSKFRFYDSCGSPKSSGGYRRNDYKWMVKEYGNGQMSLFLRIRELEKLKKDTKDQLDQLLAKSEEMEEYESEIEIEDEQEEEMENNDKNDDDKNNENEEKKEENDKNDNDDNNDDNNDKNDDDDTPKTPKKGATDNNED